jgi:ankyrin repeat protein
MIRGEIRSQWCKNGFRLFLPATLTFTALVSADSEFMAACRDGDLARMHTLLVDGRASPMDRTDEGVTPLCLTIKNGHTEATRLLLESGADATEAFGEKETSPLCWAVKHRHLDICRLLIRRRASFHHLTLHGWSALFYLWPTTTAGCHPLSADMIKVLVGEEMDFDYLHQGIVDRHGWGLIHRASVFGRPEDVELLIAVGVDAFQPIGDPAFGWTTIHNVVDYGVHGNFLVLFPKYVERYGNNPALDRDSRGWTLLHIAIAQPGERFHQGHTRIIRTLLEFGADAYALTDAIQEQHDGPERQDVPEVGGDDEVESAAFPPRIHGIRCSPSELALAYGGTERQLEWQNILQNFVNNSNAAAGHETDAHETDDDRHYDSDGDDDWPETMDTPIE